MSRRHALVRSGLTLVGLRDWAVPVALAALGAAESWDNAVPDSGAQSVQTPAALLVALPLIWRRRAPVLALAAVLAGFVPVWFTEHRTGGPSFAAVVSLLLALYSVGAHADRRIGRPAALAALAGLVGLLAADVASGNLRAVDAVGTFLFFPAAWLGGDIVAGRHLRVLALEQHAADLERDQDQRARAAVAEERARIAREMHDVLAHTTSMIVLQGGAARQVLRSAPDTAEQLLLSIEETGRDALGELRRLLGLLRDDDEPTMLAPQPGLARLDCLLGEVTTAGVRVEHYVEGRPVPLPPGLDLAAYRIVQEALTNIVKHAGPVPATVIVRYRPHDLELEIRNRGGCQATPASTRDGRGLVGMRERAAMYGGSLTTRSVPDGGYLVHARLPLQRAGP